LLSIAGVALGVAIVCAIHVVDHDTIESQYRKLRGDGERTDVEVVPRAPGEAAAIEARLRAVAGVRGVGRWRQAVAIAIAEQRIEVAVFGLAPLPQVAFAHYRVEAGADLTALRRRLPRRLSGGEMQRVSIARALVTRPPLLLADEPTGNLSSKAGEATIKLLRNVGRELQTSVLLVTHNPRDAAAGDRVLFLHDGTMDEGQALTGGSFCAADVFRRLEELGI
jgi:ABC-type hemin transport system ATPase subunit